PSPGPPPAPATAGRSRRWPATGSEIPRRAGRGGRAGSNGRNVRACDDPPWPDPALRLAGDRDHTKLPARPDATGQGAEWLLGPPMSRGACPSGPRLHVEGDRQPRLAAVERHGAVPGIGREQGKVSGPGRDDPAG